MIGIPASAVNYSAFNPASAWSPQPTILNELKFHPASEATMLADKKW